ncbi:hypothetical protein FRAHR75_1760004 [Frankia sp. Hr75.2]|nr:hypothetical protein FRAHR75_1760004 [Frankia sp. Hr75.2]
MLRAHMSPPASDVEPQPFPSRLTSIALTGLHVETLMADHDKTDRLRKLAPAAKGCQPSMRYRPWRITIATRPATLAITNSRQSCSYGYEASLPFGMTCHC